MIMQTGLFKSRAHSHGMNIYVKDPAVFTALA
jgi:hypothetical protein